MNLIINSMHPKLIGLEVKVVTEDTEYFLIENEIGLVEEFDATKNKFFVNFGSMLNLYLPAKILIPIEKFPAKEMIKNLPNKIFRK